MNIPWRKGHLRDENSASKCRWREIETRIPTRERPAEVAAIEIPGRAKQQMVREVAGLPYDAVKCTSPARLAELGELSRDIVVAIPLAAIDTTLEVCRHCPFWEVGK